MTDLYDIDATQPNVNFVMTEPSNVKVSTEAAILQTLERIKSLLSSIDRSLIDIKYHMKK